MHFHREPMVSVSYQWTCNVWNTLGMPQFSYSTVCDNVGTIGWYSQAQNHLQFQESKVEKAAMYKSFA